MFDGQIGVAENRKAKDMFNFFSSLFLPTILELSFSEAAVSAEEIGRQVGFMPGEYSYKIRYKLGGFMKNKLFLVLGIATLLTANAFASGGFDCREIDSNTGKIVEDGEYLFATISRSFGGAISGKVKLRDPGHVDILLDVSQYKLNRDELYFLSVMDLPKSGPNGALVQRKVELNTMAISENVTRGTLKESFTNQPGIPIPVECTIE